MCFVVYIVLWWSNIQSGILDVVNPNVIGRQVSLGRLPVGACIGLESKEISSRSGSVAIRGTEKMQSTCC
jgi:hypothetical protein